MSIQTTAIGEKPRRNIFGVHPNIFFLGLVSLFTDISSEMIFTIMPLFVVNVLGNGALAVGFIGGLTESFDAFFRIFAGRISDKLKKRKLLAVLGYGFSTIVKPFMYIATSWGGALAVRLGDRIGKGVRSSPRDALVADSVTKEQRGKSFGIHRAMDTAGAMLGLYFRSFNHLLPAGKGLKAGAAHLPVAGSWRRDTFGNSGRDSAAVRPREKADCSYSGGRKRAGSAYS